MKNFIIIISIIAVIALIVVFTGGKDETSQGGATDTNEVKTGTKVGNLAPDFELTDYDGNIVRLSDFRGKNAVFVNFWASWCPFCVDELPLMARMQEEFGDSYVTIAIDRGESIETAKKFTDSLNVSDSFLFVMNSSDKLYSKYGGFSMPYSVFIDKDGIIKKIKRGPLQEDELRGNINSIL